MIELQAAAKHLKCMGSTAAEPGSLAAMSMRHPMELGLLVRVPNGSNLFLPLIGKRRFDGGIVSPNSSSFLLVAPPSEATVRIGLDQVAVPDELKAGRLFVHASGVYVGVEWASVRSREYGYLNLGTWELTDDFGQGSPRCFDTWTLMLDKPGSDVPYTFSFEPLAEADD